MRQRSLERAHGFLLAATLAVGLAANLAASPTVVITSPLSGGTWLSATDAVTLQLDRPLAPADGRLAILIDDTDWTSLFTLTDTVVRYQSSTFPLPSGEHALVAYLVTPSGQWQEQERFPLRVLTPRGFERATAAPVLDIGLTGQVAEGHEPALPAPARERFQDLRVGTGLRSTFVRSGWTAAGTADVLGVNRREDALRFAERQQEAPYVDLSSYQFTAVHRRASISVGQLAIAGHRHLVSNFATRGIAGSVNVGPRVRFSGTAANATTIVGWTNPLGVAESDHRLISGSVGVEWLPLRPGGLLTEVTIMDGARLPQSGYTQGAITDAERNRGIGLRVAGNDQAQRLRIDGGWSRSRFDNPADPLLAQGASLVEVAEETRDARYLDASYAVLQNRQLGRIPVTFVAGVRHERVDPLFRVIAANIRPDIQQNAIDFTGAIGTSTVQVSHLRAHDNLGGVASILTTRTRQTTLNTLVPLATIGGGTARSGLPVLGYQLALTQQVGDGVPVNGDFLSASQIPDQLSTNHVISAEWQQATWRAGYRFNRSFQDNRQPGRERADLANTVHSISGQVMPGARVDLGAEIAFERAENLEFDQRDYTDRVGLQGQWRMATRSALTGTLSSTGVRNDAGTRDGRQFDFTLQFAQSFVLGRRSQNKPLVQMYFRVSRQTNRLTDVLFGIADRRRAWTANTGLTFGVF